MLLRELLDISEIRDERGSMDHPVEGLACDSRRVRDGYVFFALAGQHADGHNFVDEAVTRGAVAVVVQRPVLAPSPAAYVRVPSTRRAMAHALSLIHI